MNTRPSKIKCLSCYELKPISLMREHIGNGEYQLLMACKDCQRSKHQPRFRGRRAAV